MLGLQGVLDELALPGLGALIDAVIASGYPTVILELGDLDHMTSAGLAVIARAAQRMAANSGQLTIRSPSAVVRNLLNATGLVGLMRPERSPADRGYPHSRDSHESDDDDETDLRAWGYPLDLIAQLGVATVVPSNDDVVDSSLRLVVALAQATIDGADGVSVSLRRHGQLATVAISDRTVSDMDASQYATGQAPCIDASIEGRRFLAESLADEDRWPAFTPRARSLGINSILSSPLLVSDRPVGSINMYSRFSGAFVAQDQQLAWLFADEASLMLTHAGLDLDDRQRSARFQDALLTRQVIAQAQGVLMEREGVSEDRAYTELRIHSQRTGQPLHRRAQDLIDTTRRAPSGAPDRSGESDG